jgi:hypothetical protein
MDTKVGIVIVREIWMVTAASRDGRVCLTMRRTDHTLFSAILLSRFSPTLLTLHVSLKI